MVDVRLLLRKKNLSLLQLKYKKDNTVFDSHVADFAQTWIL